MKNSLFPTLKNYKKEYLPKDIFSGIIIAAVSIPISMGYAQISGIPAVYGLYGSVLPILLFALFSTSRQFIFGVDAAPAAIVGGALSTLGIAAESEAAMDYVPAIALFAGLWLFIFFLLHADKIVDFISTPVMGGFISGIAVTIILMQIPKLSKVIVNVGCGESKGNAKEIEAICKDIATITGQKPITTKARKSVANFKVREGETVGVKVTLRGDRMWEFLDRLFNVALPRVRDFRGINPNSFDGRGNYAFGLKEQLIFPEIEYDKVDKIRGMDICICTTATTDEEAKELLTMVGAPFYA